MGGLSYSADVDNPSTPASITKEFSTQKFAFYI
jgi:hypothetical protein